MKKQIIHIIFLIFTLIICSSSSVFSQRLRIVFNLSADTLHQCTVRIEKKVGKNWQEYRSFYFEGFYWSRNVENLEHGVTYRVVGIAKNRRGILLTQNTEEFTYQGQNITAKLHLVVPPNFRSILIPIIHELKIQPRIKE